MRNMTNCVWLSKDEDEENILSSGGNFELHKTCLNLLTKKYKTFFQCRKKLKWFYEKFLTRKRERFVVDQQKGSENCSLITNSWLSESKTFLNSPKRSNCLTWIINCVEKYLKREKISFFYHFSGFESNVKPNNRLT